MYDKEKEIAAGLHRSSMRGEDTDAPTITGRLDDARSMQRQSMAMIENLIERIHGACNPTRDDDKVQPRICLGAQAENLFRDAAEIRDRLAFLQSII